eukprot:GHVT01099442.1.p1 GENE.GHVT01099442.1~~GHVT01099442.1.p1  ORF type:complete len:365 (+),score=68.47 GHVT01099442.1:260-1354(+)
MAPSPANSRAMAAMPSLLALPALALVLMPLLLQVAHADEIGGAAASPRRLAPAGTKKLIVAANASADLYGNHGELIGTLVSSGNKFFVLPPEGDETLQWSCPNGLPYLTRADGLSVAYLRLPDQSIELTPRHKIKRLQAMPNPLGTQTWAQKDRLRRVRHVVRRATASLNAPEDDESADPPVDAASPPKDEKLAMKILGSVVAGALISALVAAVVGTVAHRRRRKTRAKAAENNVVASENLGAKPSCKQSSANIKTEPKVKRPPNSRAVRRKEKHNFAKAQGSFWARNSAPHTTTLSARGRRPTATREVITSTQEPVDNDIKETLTDSASETAYTNSKTCSPTSALQTNAEYGIDRQVSSSTLG